MCTKQPSQPPGSYHTGPTATVCKSVLILILMLCVCYPADVRTWAFNPPGGLVTRNLNKVLDTFCTSLVVGKDAVSRGTVNNLSRLMDEMVTALARCR